MTAPLLGIATALREELAAVRAALASLPLDQKKVVRLIKGGVGPAAAAKVARNLCQTPGLKILCATGFSGGLLDTLAHGEIVLGRSVAGVHETEAQRTFTNQALARAKIALLKHGIACHAEVLVSVEKPIFRAEEKSALGISTGAAAVDMESAALAHVAFEEEKFFFVLRVISDTVSENLPNEVGEFLDENGSVRAGSVLKYALRSPKNVRELWKLKGRSDLAADAMQAAWKVVLPVLIELSRG